MQELRPLVGFNKDVFISGANNESVAGKFMSVPFPSRNVWTSSFQQISPSKFPSRQTHKWNLLTKHTWSVFSVLPYTYNRGRGEREWFRESNKFSNSQYNTWKCAPEFPSQQEQAKNTSGERISPLHASVNMSCMILRDKSNDIHCLQNKSHLNQTYCIFFFHSFAQHVNAFVAATFEDS